MRKLIDDLLVENYSRAVAFFNAEGMLSRNNHAWEMMCHDGSMNGLILFYEDFTTMLNIAPLEQDRVQDMCNATCNEKTVQIMQRRLSTGGVEGIMVEVEDISNSERSMVQSDRILADTMWKIRSRIATVQNVLTLFIDYHRNALTPELQELIFSCRREVWELERQAENLRYLLQIDVGHVKLTTQPESLTIKDCIDNVVMQCEPLLRSFTKEPEITVAADPSLQIVTDRQILEKALSALLFNALIYNDRTQPVSITAVADTYTIQITVEDKGWGITAIDQPSICSYTYRGTNAKRSSYSGLGIELYLVRRLLTLAGAGLEFISKENEGSQFTIFYWKAHKQ